MLFQDLQGKKADAPMEPIDPYRDLPATDRALMGMVERLGYTVPEAAKLLRLERAVAHRRYWLSRQTIRPAELLRDKLLARSSELRARDICALELVEVLGYSIGRAAKVMGINKGHLCRRLQMTREVIRSAGDPRVAPT